MSEPICDYSDLAVSQCAHCQGVDLPDERPIRWAGSEREAMYPGSCAHCGKRFEAGATIVCADLYGNGESDEWCLLEHTTDAFGGVW